MLDIVFVHANSSQLVYQGLAKDHAAIEPPIWAYLLHNHCMTRHINSAVLDCEVYQLSDDRCIEALEGHRTRIVCFVVYGQQPSASSQNMEGALRLAKRIKEADLNTKILFVGGHVSALPQEVLSHDCVDMVCQNEGVYTVSNLVMCLRSNGSLSKVAGLGYKEEGCVVLNPLSKIVPTKRLDYDLPMPRIVDYSGYRTAGWHSWSNNSEKSPFASIYTSLGCPFRCSFCMINVINKSVGTTKCNIYRKWSVEHVMAQLDWLAKIGIKNLKIADELFVYDPKHFLQICKEIIKRGYKFNIWCYARVDTCSPIYLEIMKKAGINFIGLGIESGDKKVRKDVVKGGFQDTSIEDIVYNIHNAGIEVGANYIFGLPEDDMESMQHTLALSIKLNTSMANFYCAMAYPGSQLYTEAIAKGISLPTTYSGFSQHSYDIQPLSSNYLTAEQVLMFRDSAWTKFHSRPEYLAMLETKFGTAAKDNVEATLKVKLKRKILGD